MNSDITLNSDILVVDDSLLILKVVHEMLNDRYNVRLAQSAEKARDMIKECPPDLILLDLEMPKTNGFEFLEELKGSPEWRNIPVIFLTGTDDRQKEEKALNLGAVDYILKPISPGIIRKRIRMRLEFDMYQKNLEKLIDLRTNQLLTTQDLIIDILANVTTYRDNDTGAHIIRTSKYSQLIVDRLLEVRHPDYIISDIYAQDVVKSVKMHDIGKVAVPDSILLKKGKLTLGEFEIIKSHTTIGSKMIDNAIALHGVNASFFDTAREVILYHHEWWNGSGYPKSLKGRDIPISARIMAVADVYDALISNRPYRLPLPHDEAVTIITAEAGAHFDSILVDIIQDILPKFEEIAYAFQDE